MASDDVALTTIELQPTNYNDTSNKIQLTKIQVPSTATLQNTDGKIFSGETDVPPADGTVQSIPKLSTKQQPISSTAAAIAAVTATSSDILKNIDDIVESKDPDPNKFVTKSTSSAGAASGGDSSTFGGHAGRHEKEKRLGHRRVTQAGEITYKRIQTSHIMGSIQLGIQHTVGSLANKPKRDLLMNDFCEIESISFPEEGSNFTPAHHYSDFKFKIYAPIAFRYFRDLFGIQPDDFMISMCLSPLRELSNPGASGSIFYLTDDDEFIIKTVQHKEGEFLQKLLPGYYMNLNQNPRTLLPKFFGLYCFQCNSKNVRLVVMNNLLPSCVKMHLKYDLKGSTFKRKASKQERKKESPTYKDLDFMEHHPNGIYLEADTYAALMKTIQRDCTVLESFQIMDYSLLLGIHNLDIAAKEKSSLRVRTRTNSNSVQLPSTTSAPPSSQQPPVQNAKFDRAELEDAPEADQFIMEQNQEAAAAAAAAEEQARKRAINRNSSIYKSFNRQRLVAHSTAMESIQAESEPTDGDDDVPTGGIPARNEKGDRLLLFIGIIDILQSYRLVKKLEHTFKSIIYDGDTVSVCRPSFYAQRFQNFMAKIVFKKIPYPLKPSPSKRKSVSKYNPLHKQPLEQTPSGFYSIPSTSSQSHHYHHHHHHNPYHSTGVSGAGHQILPGVAGPSSSGIGISSTTISSGVERRGSDAGYSGSGTRSSVGSHTGTFKSTIRIPPTNSRYSNSNSAPSCSSTPPPAFDDISEKSLQRSNISYDQQRSQDSSDQGVNSDLTCNEETDMAVTKYTVPNSIQIISNDSTDTVSISKIVVEKVSVRVEKTIHLDQSGQITS